MRKWFTVQETVDMLRERGKLDKLGYFPYSISKTPVTVLKSDTPNGKNNSTITNGSLFLERNFLTTADS